MLRIVLPMLLLLCAVFQAQAQKSETRQIADFNRVSVSGGFDKVVFLAADETSVLIETSGMDPEKVKTEVNGSHLHIGMKKGSSGSGRITLTVRYRQLTELNNSGSSDIEIAGTLKGNAFSYNASGSGDLSGIIAVEDLSVKISGSCDTEWSGQATNQKFAISGSGDIRAGNLKGKKASVAISGSGDVELNVSGNVSTKVSGSGIVQNIAQ